jgi:hypothetical protein
MKKILLVAVAVVFAGGCRGDGLLSPNVLTYSATTRVVTNFYGTPAIPSVETTVRIANNTDHTITFNYSRGDCGGLELHAFSSADMSGTPTWNSFQPGLECDLVGYLPSPLDPGQSVELVISGPLKDILTAGHPNGTYYFEVLLNVGGGDVRDSDVHIPAGSVFLAR